MLEAWNRGFIQLGIIIGMLVPLLVVVWWAMSHDHGESYRPSNISPNKHYGGPLQDNETNPKNLQNSTEVKALEELGTPDHPGHQNYYDHQDLKQQTSMAEATEAIVRLTISSLILGTVGTGLIFLTLYETRKATTQVTKSNEIAKQGVLDAQGPHVFVMGVKPRFDIKIEEMVRMSDKDLKEFFFEFKYQVNNLGKTPAVIHKACVSTFFSPELPDTPDFPYHADIWPDKIVIAAERGIELATFLREGKTREVVSELFRTRIHRPGAVEMNIFVCGYICYRSVFDTEHEIGFAYRFIPHAHVLEEVPSEAYNYRRKLS